MKLVPKIIWTNPEAAAAQEAPPAAQLTRQALTYQDAAILLGKSPRTIRRWVAFGLLPVARVTQRTVLVCRTAVEALLRASGAWGREEVQVVEAHRRG